MNDPSRRDFCRTLRALAVAGPSLLLVNPLTARAAAANASEGAAAQERAEPYPPQWLPTGIRSRFADNVNGLRVHLLEAGYDQPGRPALLLLHGFPELAYSWRKVMLPLAEAGYHVMAPDLRGYGRTTGWDSDYDADLTPFRMLNKVRDVMGLIAAFGYRHVDCVIGHDFGSPLAAWCALVRPDLFRSVVLMSAPFGGPPSVPFDTVANPPAGSPAGVDIHEQLARLPRPRKHYQRYYQTRAANPDMWQAEQGLADFIRAYYHYKSADWEGNEPFRLAARTATEWARMPTYYIMDLDVGMAETVAPYLPDAATNAANTWLSDAELAVYVTEFGRTGFQGGLNSYRMGASGIGAAEMQLFAGRTIDQPAMFISGASDWGTYQNPGAFERMQQSACTNMRDVHLLAGAGHWVQQEQAQATSRLLLSFLRKMG